MRAVIYARVSTDDQEHNYSLPSQIEACRRYASERGMQVVADVQDVASGAILERPGLA
ncbi:MAG: recombinase family protein [Roseiflexus sp.]|jgi:DNA invertase Pin-like site-specific DNA recombinase|nr:recombinase family protein [Roseiflexus sp.]MBO9335451.1 recombinase family protein [Roseiflexus sp.]MBO9342667.1 recombinase family protein [Roseiflexus sp.]MBO9364487.1 recombinase family protein [Roseiflexus sp.]MBO9380897.1 recombinase family protein [Roseiflexus sp.]